MIKIYPSSYAPPAGITTDSKYNNGCPRYEVFKCDLTIPRTNIHPLYAAVGAFVENYFISSIEGITDIEKPFKHFLDDDHYISGRMDAACDNFIYEFKGSFSKPFYSTIIRKGVINPNHLGQLLTYMCIEERSQGKLMCAYVHFNKKLLLELKTRVFFVEIREEGQIFIDGEDYGTTVNDLMRFYSNIVNAHKDPAFPPATINDNACNYCPMKDLCAFGPKEKEAFSREVKQLKGDEKVLIPKINIHNTRR